MACIRPNPPSYSIFTLLDYIKATYGESAYNTMINYKRPRQTGEHNYSLKELIDYAAEHDGHMPYTVFVSLFLETPNYDITQWNGNFAINILEGYIGYHTNGYNSFLMDNPNSPGASVNEYRVEGGSWKRGGLYRFAVTRITVQGRGTAPRTIQYAYTSADIKNTTYYTRAYKFAMESISSPDYSDGMFAGSEVIKKTCQEPDQLLYITYDQYKADGNSSSSRPQVFIAKGYQDYYELTDAEYETYVSYSAPLKFKPDLVPIDGINSTVLDFKRASETYMVERYKGEAGRFIDIADPAGTYGDVAFTNETTGATYDSVTYAKPLQIPNEVYSGAGYVRADLYGTGTSASTIQKQIRFRVNDIPSNVIEVTGVTGGTNVKSFTVKGNNKIQFLWSHTGNTNPVLEILDDDMMVKNLDVWNDSDTLHLYRLTPTNNQFVIPLSYFDLKGTFHGLLISGNGEINSVVTEFIWNFE